MKQLLFCEASGIGIGIVTHGGACISNTYLFCSATAQRFTRPELIAAIQEFPGQNVTYADANHPTTIPDGTFFRPFPIIQDAVGAVASGGILSLVEGIYPGAVSINTAMRIEAPVGTVVIGGTGISPAIANAGRPEGGSTEIVGDSDDSSRNTLLHNFPNPFNPATQIEFELRARSHVDLAIFDIMGRKVKVLVNEIKDEGLHQVIFDGSGLATGPYFYRMNVDGNVMTRIMLLIK